MASLICQNQGLGLQISLTEKVLKNEKQMFHATNKVKFAKKKNVSLILSNYGENLNTEFQTRAQNLERNENFEDFSGRRNFCVTVVTALISFGKVNSSLAEENSSNKTKNLPIEEIKAIIERDIKDGQYFITGDLTRSIYRDDCRFKDPTNETKGLEKYLQAVSLLFDPKMSKQELISISVTGTNTVEAKWNLGGFLKFPWRPRVATFEGSTIYSMDSEGLISLHDEKWSISPLTAIIETFTPNFRLL